MYVEINIILVFSNILQKCGKTGVIFHTLNDLPSPKSKQKMLS